MHDGMVNYVVNSRVGIMPAMVCARRIMAFVLELFFVDIVCKRFYNAKLS